MSMNVMRWEGPMDGASSRLIYVYPERVCCAIKGSTFCCTVVCVDVCGWPEMSNMLSFPEK